MAIALGILFAVVVVLYPLILHLIPVVLLCVLGLFANLVQAFCFVFIWPISKNAYTRINGVVKELDWLVLLGLIDWCAGVKILVCAEQETSHLKGKEHELVISNARSDADHLVELRVTSTQRMAENSVLDAHTSEIQFVNGRVPQSISEIRGLVCEDITRGLEGIAIPASNLVDDPPVAPTGPSLLEYQMVKPTSLAYALPVDVVNMVILASIKELRLKVAGALFSLICEV